MINDYQTFITNEDIVTVIRPAVLDVVLNDADTEKTILPAMIAAMNEVKSYLASRYDVATMFAAVYQWTKAAEFAEGARVIMIADLWLVGTTYSNGTYVSNTGAVGGKIYRAKNSPTAGTVLTDTSKFDFVCNYADYFSAKIDVAAASFEIDNTTYWLAGDTRDPLLVRYVVDLFLYEFFCRINPRNVPEMRIQRRDDAVKWLKLVSDPRNNINPNFPERDHGTNKGVDITFGSNAKQSHYY